MIKHKKKVCSSCGKEDYLFGYTLCKYCYNKKKFQEKLAKKKLKSTPKKTKIKQVSEKRKESLNEYNKVKAEYFREHPCCEVGLPGCYTCDERVRTLHHKKGRIGELLTNKEFFLTACISCHQLIEENPLMARENGWSLSRLD